MPNGPMESFLTRRSVAVLTGSLAFAVTYWYIRRQRKETSAARTMKSSDDADLRPQENFRDSNLYGSPLITKPSDDVMTSGFNNVGIDAGEKSEEDSAEEIMESSLFWKESETEKQKISVTIKGENVISKQNSIQNINECKRVNTPSSEGHYCI
uniref:Uncharacterized protein n=1 Tax=Setaria digitata TaxID=48799 RepID=A0A915PRJ6_9BILA